MGMLAMVVALTTSTATSAIAQTRHHSDRVALASFAPKAEAPTCKNVCPKTGKCLDTK